MASFGVGSSLALPLSFGLQLVFSWWCSLESRLQQWEPAAASHFIAKNNLHRVRRGPEKGYRKFRGRGPHRELWPFIELSENLIHGVNLWFQYGRK